MTRASIPGLRLTSRDLRVLEALGDHRFLSVPQLAVLFFPSRGGAETRLRKLLAHGLVVRVFMPARPYDRRAHAIFGLSAMGSREVARALGGQRPGHLSPREQRSGLFLDHTLRRNDLRICLTRLTQRRPDIQLVRWEQSLQEVRSAAVIPTSDRWGSERVPLVPDGVFHIIVRKKHETCAVEIDMGTVRRERMAKRYAAYWTWWRRGNPHMRYGPMPYRVLTLTTTQARLEALRHEAKRAPGRDAMGSGLFWFTLLSHADIDAPEKLLGDVWTTARHPDQPAKPLFADA